jgi:hypothetical protein
MPLALAAFDAIGGFAVRFGVVVVVHLLDVKRGRGAVLFVVVQREIFGDGNILGAGIDAILTGCAGNRYVLEFAPVHRRDKNSFLETPVLFCLFDQTSLRASRAKKKKTAILAGPGRSSFVFSLSRTFFKTLFFL